uniref:Uncharacterized protein n=1 Tax=Peronospora matthiolae TaxID=2874970 RepID=A0AAV1V5D5_9STRA
MGNKARADERWRKNKPKRPKPVHNLSGFVEDCAQPLNFSPRYHRHIGEVDVATNKQLLRRPRFTCTDEVRQRPNTIDAGHVQPKASLWLGNHAETAAMGGSGGSS